MTGRHKTWDVVVVGDLFMDVVMTGFNHLPRLGEELFAGNLRQEIGGGAAITASGLARLGLNVAVIGVVGREDGIWITKRLMSAGVNASALAHHPDEPSGVTVSVSTPQDRAFLTYYGANEQLPQLLREPHARDIMASARHVHFACAPDAAFGPMLFAELHERNCKVSIDVGWHESWLADRHSLAVVRAADLFFPNEREGERMTGLTEPREMLEFWRAKGLRHVALKLGSTGAMLLWNGEIIEGPPYPVTAVDTTGAGDCFDAGFIYGWLNDESIESSLQIAAICGALSTRGLGGLETFPNMAELEEALVMVRT